MRGVGQQEEKEKDEEGADGGSRSSAQARWLSGVRTPKLQQLLYHWRATAAMILHVDLGIWHRLRARRWVSGLLPHSRRRHIGRRIRARRCGNSVRLRQYHRGIGSHLRLRRLGTQLRLRRRPLAQQTVRSHCSASVAGLRASPGAARHVAPSPSWGFFHPASRPTPPFPCPSVTFDFASAH